MNVSCRRATFSMALLTYIKKDYNMRSTSPIHRVLFLAALIAACPAYAADSVLMASKTQAVRTNQFATVGGLSAGAIQSSGHNGITTSATSPRVLHAFDVIVLTEPPRPEWEELDALTNAAEHWWRSDAGPAVDKAQEREVGRLFDDLRLTARLPQGSPAHFAAVQRVQWRLDRGTTTGLDYALLGVSFEDDAEGVQMDGAEPMRQLLSLAITLESHPTK